MTWAHVIEQMAKSDKIMLVLERLAEGKIPVTASCRAAGCDDYVAKPYSPRQLLAKIRQYIPQ